MHTEKVVQLMRFFAEKLGGKVSDVKLMKLMYFTDRLSIEETGYPLSYDDYYSMNRGPILSGAKNIIDRYENPLYVAAFNQTVACKSPKGYSVNLLSLKAPGVDTENLEEDDFDLLSQTDREIVQRVLDKMGALDDDNVVVYAHDKKVCPEWEWADGSSKPIKIESILSHLGYSPEQRKSHAAEINYFKNIVAQ